jgi:hypothetical protein
MVPKLINALTTNHIWCAIKSTSYLPYRSETNEPIYATQLVAPLTYSIDPKSMNVRTAKPYMTNI